MEKVKSEGTKLDPDHNLIDRPSESTINTYGYDVQVRVLNKDLVIPWGPIRLDNNWKSIPVKHNLNRLEGTPIGASRGEMNYMEVTNLYSFFAAQALRWQWLAHFELQHPQFVTLIETRIVAYKVEINWKKTPIDIEDVHTMLDTGLKFD